MQVDMKQVDALDGFLSIGHILTNDRIKPLIHPEDREHLCILYRDIADALRIDDTHRMDGITHSMKGSTDESNKGLDVSTGDMRKENSAGGGGMDRGRSNPVREMRGDTGSEGTPGPRPIYKIAEEIRRTWPNASPYAKPYIEAMQSLECIEDNYYLDSGREIVLRFLCNAQTWRGEDARRIKKELKTICGIK